MRFGGQVDSNCNALVLSIGRWIVANSPAYLTTCAHHAEAAHAPDVSLRLRLLADFEFLQAIQERLAGHTQETRCPRAIASGVAERLFQKGFLDG